MHYYPFAVKLGNCLGSCNTLNDLSNKVCVLNKTEDLNIHVFNMITGKNESKIELKIYHVNVNVNLKEEDVFQIKSGITINVDASVKNMYVENIFGVLLHVVVKMDNI